MTTEIVKNIAYILKHCIHFKTLPSTLTLTTLASNMQLFRLTVLLLLVGFGMAYERRHACSPDVTKHCSDTCIANHPDFLPHQPNNIAHQGFQNKNCYFDFVITPIQGIHNQLIVILRLNEMKGGLASQDCFENSYPQEVVMQGLNEVGDPFGWWNFNAEHHTLYNYGDQFCSDPLSIGCYNRKSRLRPDESLSVEIKDCPASERMMNKTGYERPPTFVRLRREEPQTFASMTARDNTFCAIWQHNLTIKESPNPSVAFIGEVLPMGQEFVIKVTSPVYHIELGKTGKIEEPWKCILSETDIAKIGSAAMSFSVDKETLDDVNKRTKPDPKYFEEADKGKDHRQRPIIEILPTLAATTRKPKPNINKQIIQVDEDPFPEEIHPPSHEELLPEQPSKNRRNKRPNENEKKKEELDIYERCELTKRCLAGSANPRKVGEARGGGAGSVDPCILSKDCDILVAYGDGSAQGKFGIPETYAYMEIVGKSNFWVALGLSVDRFMGSDFVVECVRDRNRETVELYTSWNWGIVSSTGAVEGNTRMNRSDPKYATFVKPYQSGHVEHNGRHFLYCKFSLEKLFQFNAENQYGDMQTYHFNLVKSRYYVLMALGKNAVPSYKNKGLAGESGNLNYHGDYYRFVSGSRVTIGTRFSPTPFEQTMIYLHGFSMYLTFLFFFPNAVFLGRYYKETFVEITYFGVKTWLLWHIILHTCGLVLLLLGHFFLTFANEGWTPVGPEDPDFHFWTALISATVYFYNSFMGFLNLDRNTTRGCDGWQWLHAFNGHISYIVALACLAGAHKVQYSHLPCSASGVVIGWMCVYLLFQIVASYHYCWLDWIHGHHARVYAIGLRELLVRPENDEVAPGFQVRIYILIAFASTSALFTIIMMAIAGNVVSNGSDGACFPDEYFIAP